MAHSLTSLGLYKDKVDEPLEPPDTQAIDRGKRGHPLNKAQVHSTMHHPCPSLDHSHDFPLVLPHANCCITENTAFNTSPITSLRLITSLLSLSTDSNQNVNPCSQTSTSDVTLSEMHPEPLSHFKTSSRYRICARPLSLARREARRTGNAKRAKSVPSRGSIGVTHASSCLRTHEMLLPNPFDGQVPHSTIKRHFWRLADKTWHQIQTAPEVCPFVFLTELMAQQVATDASARDVGVLCDARHMSSVDTYAKGRRINCGRSQLTRECALCMPTQGFVGSLLQGDESMSDDRGALLCTPTTCAEYSCRNSRFMRVTCSISIAERCSTKPRQCIQHNKHETRMRSITAANSP